MEVTIVSESSSTPAEAIDTRKDYWETRATKALELYGGGFILFFGVFGNIMSLAVLSRKKMRTMTMSVYLSGVAVCDMGFILLGQAGRHWVRNLSGIDLNNLANWYCIGWMLFINTLTCMSSFLLAGVSAERCFAVTAPLKSIGVITRKSAVCYLVCIGIMATLYSSHVFWSFQLVETPDRSSCTINDKYYFATHIRVWTDFFILFLVPGSIIIISNIIIMYKVTKAKIKRDVYLAKGTNDKNQTYSTIAMLVTVCVAYVCLTTPLRIVYFIGSVFPSGIPLVGREAARYRLFWGVSILAAYVNHAINFYLYVISGKEFRTELRYLLVEIFCKACRLKDGFSQSAVGSSERNRPRLESDPTVA